MRYRIKTHQDFDKEFKRLCKKYSSLKADLSALGKSLSENPDQGTSLGKGVRKVRMVFSSRRRHTRFKCDWSSDVCSSDLQRYKKTLKINFLRKNHDILVLFCIFADRKSVV